MKLIRISSACRGAPPFYKTTGLLVARCLLLVLLFNGKGITQPVSHYIEPYSGQMLVISPDLFDGLSPGDTICLKGGSYGQLLIRGIHGTTDSLITIRNCQGQVVICNEAHFGIALHNSSYIHLTGNGCDDHHPYGLVINGTSGNGISVDRKSTNIEISHTEIGHAGMSGIMAKTDPVCDDLSSVRDSFALFDLFIHHNYIHNTVNEGIYAGSSNYTGHYLHCNGRDTLVLPHEVIGVRIMNNRLERTGRNSVQVSSAPVDCVISHNTIIHDSQSGISHHMNGIQVGGGSRCNVYNNKIHDGRGSGIHYFGQGPGMVFNNLIVRPGRSHFPDRPANEHPVHGIFVRPVYAETTDPVHIVHNTIVEPKTTGIRFDNVRTKNNLIKNNIIIGAGGFAYTGRDAFIRLLSEEVDVESSHNYFDTGIQMIRFNDALNGDYSLDQWSPAINAGVDLQDMGIDFDINDNPRPYGPASDIGAYEFQEMNHFPPATPAVLNVYPNPATSSIRLLLPYQTDDVERIIIYDDAGKRLLVLKNDQACVSLAIPVWHLSGGKYHIRVFFGDHFATGSFIKL